MAYTPSSFTPTDKYGIRWVQNGETGDQDNLNRAVDDLSNLTIKLVNDLSETSNTKPTAMVCSSNVLSVSTAAVLTLTGPSQTGSVTATTVTNSNIITVNASILNTKILVGATVTGSGIQSGTLVTEVKFDGSNQIVLNKVVTSGGTNTTVNYSQSISQISVDNIALSATNIVLVTGQVVKSQNGLYVVSSAGNSSTPWILTRPSYANTWDKIASALVVVDKGTLNKDTVWICTADASGGTLGTTDISFVNLYNTNIVTMSNASIFTTNISIASTTQQTLPICIANKFRTLKILIQCSENIKYHTSELLCIHNNSDVFLTEYSIVHSAGELASFDANISSGNINLLIKSASSNSTYYKIIITAINI